MSPKIKKGELDITKRGMPDQPQQKQERQLKISRSPVNSSNIVSVGYDEPTMTLDVEFYTGHLYRYENVPPIIYDRLKQAESPGGFFQKNIARSFTYKKLV